MRRHALLLLVCLIPTNHATFGQDRPAPISLVRLIANPEKFEGKLVTVRGYLIMTGPRDLVTYILFLHKDDADNILGNSIGLAPNKQMERDREKINGMYVQVSGRVKSVRISGTADAYLTDLEDVSNCVVWSDPSRPIALKGLDKPNR